METKKVLIGTSKREDFNSSRGVKVLKSGTESEIQEFFESQKEKEKERIILEDEYNKKKDSLKEEDKTKSEEEKGSWYGTYLDERLKDIQTKMSEKRNIFTYYEDFLMIDAKILE